MNVITAGICGRGLRQEITAEIRRTAVVKIHSGNGDTTKWIAER
jgi:hypothetical protein